MTEFEDGTFDILNCINLFTSMPSEARAKAAKEFFRVLAPGGIVSFNDAVQKHDRAGQVLDLITEKYNEEMLASYQTEDLNQIFFDAGFKPGPTYPIIAASSKVMSWVKPTEDESPEDIKEMQMKSVELFKSEMVEVMDEEMKTDTVEEAKPEEEEESHVVKDTENASGEPLITMNAEETEEKTTETVVEAEEKPAETAVEAEEKPAEAGEPEDKTEA